MGLNFRFSNGFDLVLSVLFLLKSNKNILLKNTSLFSPHWYNQLSELSVCMNVCLCVCVCVHACAWGWEDYVILESYLLQTPRSPINSSLRMPKYIQSFTVQSQAQQTFQHCLDDFACLKQKQSCRFHHALAQATWCVCSCGLNTNFGGKFCPSGQLI